MIKLPPDITFVIQLVGFVVFWQLMKVILFVPVQHALEMRAARTRGARARAEDLRGEAGTVASEIEARLGDARVEGKRLADEIRRLAETEEQAILARHRDESAALLERERSVTATQVQAARVPLQAEVERLAASVVAKVLGRAA